MVLLLPVPWWIMVLLQASYTCTNAACSNALPTSLQTPGVQLAYCLCRGGWCIWYRPHTRTQTQHAQTQCLLSANTWCAARLLPVPWWMVHLGSQPLDWWLAAVHPDGVAAQPARRKVGFLNACKDGRV